MQEQVASSYRQRSVAHVRVRQLLVALAVAATLWPHPTVAHEIPADVTVLAFVRPQGQRLVLAVRVPLEAMRDIEFPRNGPYLDIAAADGLLLEAAQRWVAGEVRLFEDGAPLVAPTVVAWRVSLPSDRSFSDFQQARGSFARPPLPATTAIVPAQAMLDILLETPIHSERSNFAIGGDLARLGIRTTTVLRYITPDGADRAFQFTGDPGVVALDPRWHQAIARFVALGTLHILDGIDHLLFLICLILPCRRIRPLVAIVTSFTVAHSATLIASAAGMAPGGLWFPPLIEVLIALSIVAMAVENVVGARIERRWRIAFVFGLVHGFGFSFALRETLQFAGSHLLTSLLAFNVGVELGQLLLIVVAVPLLNLAFRRVVSERAGILALSVLVAHSAWHWMAERWADLRAFRLDWPAFDAYLLASLLRWAALALVVAAAAWVLRGAVRRIDPPSQPKPAMTRSS